MKSNYGPSDGKIPLKWDNGVYALDHHPHEARA